MKQTCSLCGNKDEVGSENCFGFRYLCKDCTTFIWIRYNPGIYSFKEVENKVNKILSTMKDRFKD